MYIDRNRLDLYPYWGTFYRIGVDDSLPLDEQIEQEYIVFETQCDVTESSHSWSNNFIWAKYAIYFPYEKGKDEIAVRLGDLFKADVHGLLVNGKVVGVFPTQLDGVTVYIQDTDI